MKRDAFASSVMGLILLALGAARALPSLTHGWPTLIHLLSQTSSIRVGAADRGGVVPGEVLVAGMAGPIGLLGPGCADPTTAPSLPGWPSALSSPSRPWVPCPRAQLPAIAATGIIATRLGQPA